MEVLETDDLQFNVNYGLLPPEQTVIIRAYSDDTDDQVLAEIRPRYIVMFEPNQDFIRRIEVGPSHSCNRTTFDVPVVRSTAIRTRGWASGYISCSTA